MPIQEERPASIFVIPFVQLFMGLFLFISLLYGFYELILFTGILLGIGLGANIWGRLSPSGIVCELSVDRQKAFPGEKVELRIHITNAKYLPVLLHMSLQLDSSLVEEDLNETAGATPCGLLWYQSCRFQRRLSPRHRGVYKIGPPSLTVGDLFGFYKKDKRLRSSVEIVVYPRLVGVRPISLAKREFYGTPGARSPVEDPIYVYGTRNYQPGRPVRRIHWKASARHHRIQEKLCEPAEQEKVMILLEVGQFMEAEATDDFERIIETAASYTVTLARKGYAVGFATNGILEGTGASIIPITRSPVQLSLILEACARVRMTPKGSLMDILSRGYPLPWGVSCLIFSYEQGEAISLIATAMRNRAFQQFLSMPKGGPVYSRIGVQWRAPATAWMRCSPWRPMTHENEAGGFPDDCLRSHAVELGPCVGGICHAQGGVSPFFPNGRGPCPCTGNSRHPVTPGTGLADDMHHWGADNRGHICRITDDLQSV